MEKAKAKANRKKAHTKICRQVDRISKSLSEPTQKSAPGSSQNAPGTTCPKERHWPINEPPNQTFLYAFCMQTARFLHVFEAV